MDRHQPALGSRGHGLGLSYTPPAPVIPSCSTVTPLLLLQPDMASATMAVRPDNDTTMRSTAIRADDSASVGEGGGWWLGDCHSHTSRRGFMPFAGSCHGATNCSGSRKTGESLRVVVNEGNDDAQSWGPLSNDMSQECGTSSNLHRCVLSGTSAAGPAVCQASTFEMMMSKLLLQNKGGLQCTGDSTRLDASASTSAAVHPCDPP